MFSCCASNCCAAAVASSLHAGGSAANFLLVLGNARRNASRILILAGNFQYRCVDRCDRGNDVYRCGEDDESTADTTRSFFPPPERGLNGGEYS